MEPKDKNYLQLQFWINVFRKNSTEFQTFFESIMSKAFPDFQKIKPHGASGDAGNDGYIPSKGAYYQVYSPADPNKTEAKAIVKLKKDFGKVLNEWDQISKVKEYHFVYNDKDSGSTIGLEKALAELRIANPSIQFSFFGPGKLEEVFFSLKQEDILSLGFDIDSTKSVSQVYAYLDRVETYLDRENGTDALKALDVVSPIISGLNEDDLVLEYEIHNARALQKLERVEEARVKFEDLSRRYKSDPRPLLHLAEYYLGIEDYEKNEEYIQLAENIDSNHWLLRLQKLLRKNRLDIDIDEAGVDEKSFPSDSRIKSSFYRIYSYFFIRSGNLEKAERYIEQAISLNPDRVNNYDAKLTFQRCRLFSFTAEEDQLEKNAECFLKEIEIVEKKANEWGDTSIRNQVLINFDKMRAFHILQNPSQIEPLAKSSFDLLMKCHFDYLIDRFFAELLTIFELPPDDFEVLLKHFQNAKKVISDDLAKAVFGQFSLKKLLISRGKEFFITTNKTTFVDLIDNLENKKFGEVIAFLEKDIKFAVEMAYTTKEFPELRKEIINNISNDGNVQQKLLLILNYDESNTDEAFEILKELDLSKLKYFECRPVLEIARKKEAWEFVVEVVEKLLEYEKEPRVTLELKLLLFNANANLKRLPDVIKIGEQLLSNNSEIELLSVEDKEHLLAQTLIARSQRGEYTEAKGLLEKHRTFSISFNFKTTIEPKIYLENNDAQKALESIISGVKIVKSPSPEQYGLLFMWFVEIGNQIDLPLISLETTVPDCFVKLAEQQRWYYIGDGNELDATKIASNDKKYPVFLNKQLGDKLFFENNYRSDTPEYTIENILPVERYILFQSRYYADELSKQHRWDAMEIIEVPHAGEKLDLTYITARLEDERTGKKDFFELYCSGNYPLALLAINEGGLVNALSTIVNENKGFVRFSTGNLAELNQQMEVARKIINGDQFFIDGTSAFILSESGFLERIYEHLPKMKIPQSVISLLLEVRDRIRCRPGQTGYLGYAQGQIRMTPVNQEEIDKIQNNLKTQVELLESNPKHIEAISDATKSYSLLEQRTPPELCDACILAQRDDSIVLTEDFFYLQANALETKKKVPEYCSSFALFRVLYEQGKITFDEYLDMFSYLGSYRFRFLPISIEEIQKAVLGDGAIKRIRPERIRNFRFNLTLSKEYGVQFDNAFTIVARYLVSILIDDAIVPEMAQKIFIEILTTFPTDKDKITMGEMFLQTSTYAIQKMQKKLIVGTRTQEKINLLSQSIYIYGPKESLWKP